MFIVFEGIDGSGKTTLSGRVAEQLTAAGISVHQARPKGELKSPLARDIRTLARDPRNLTMSPHTELFLFIARDTQTIDTVIRPQLTEADVVIADRYLYSAEVLCRARGAVPKQDIDAAVTTAARGLWPDLVVYCDVDIKTSALRKHIDKVLHPRDPEDFGRKGLAGLGLRDAMRDVYLSLAAENPDTWFTVDNAHAGIEENTYKIVNRILTAMGREPMIPPTAPPPYVSINTIAGSSNEETVDEFYNYLERLIDGGRAAEAALHLRSLSSDRAWRLRERLAATVPALIAYGLEPLGCTRALEMRRSLMEIVPGATALSLGAEWADSDEEAWALRETLAETCPDEVAATLGSLDTDRAWTLRERLIDAAPVPVLTSLRGLDTARAWKMRDKFGKKKFAPGLLRGLANLDTERAWEARDARKGDALPWFILSLLGLSSDRSWAAREQYLSDAAKLTLRSMAGSDDPRAWQMRRGCAFLAPEALTTIKNLDSEAAWSLREQFMDRWPGAAGKSVGMDLAATERGAVFLKELVSRHPDDPDACHYFVKAVEGRREEAACRKN